MIKRIWAFVAAFRGRAILIAAAVAVTILVFAMSAAIAQRAAGAAEHATRQMIESIEVAADLRQTYATLTSSMAMAATAEDSALIDAAFALNQHFDAQLAHLGRLAETNPALRQEYEALLAVRAESYAYAGPYAELVMAGRFEEAVALTESPGFSEAVGGFFPALERVLALMLDYAESTYAQSSERQNDAMVLAALGFVMVVLLWGAMTMDWAAQTRAARRAQNRLAGMNGELERRVAERTAELEQARDAAEQANRAKAEFLAAMSHELRTPLNGVLGMTTLLKRQPGNDAQKGMLEVIENSGRSLLVLLNDVLDFARLESGQMVLRSEPFELTPLLERTIERHKDAALVKQLDIHLDVSDGARQVFIGDEIRIAQAIGNLLSNAVKFTDSGSIHIVAEEKADRLRIAVRDTGCGIAPEQIKTIFEQFQQGDSSIRRRYGGAGLGLALARDLVKAMDGEIGVESAPGEGSEFWIALDLPRWTPAAERGSESDGDARQVA